MSRKVIAFFPVEVGLAHLTRSLAIAEELACRKHKVLFCLPKSRSEFVKNSPVLPIWTNEFMTAKDLDQPKKFMHKDYLLPFTQKHIEIINKYNVNTAVVDFHFAAVAACTLTNIPTFYITGSGGLPHGCQLPNPGLPAVVNQLVSPLFASIIWQIKKSFLSAIVDTVKSFGHTTTIDAMIGRMQYIIPEFEGYLPAVEVNLRRFYVGHIRWQGFSQSPTRLQSLKSTGKTVYISFGGTGLDKTKLIALTKYLVTEGYQVIVSTGTIATPNEFPQLANLWVSRFLDGERASQKADIVVCHGGYGTLMDALAAQKPAVMIPFNPDQLLHSFRFQELGLGVNLNKFRLRHIRIDNWTKYLETGKQIDIKTISETVKQVLANRDHFQPALKKYSDKMPKIPGQTTAADVIEKSFL